MGFTQDRKDEQTPYVYCLVRQDLSPSQTVVQAGHSLIEATKNFEPPQDEHPHLVVCGIRNEARLLRAADALDKAGIRYSLFREPDQNNEATALATEPICGERRSFFQRFHLLNPSADGTRSQDKESK